MFLYRFLRPAVILLFKICFLMRTKGRSNLPNKGGYIIAANHMSFLDPLVLGVACPRPLNFMARHSLFRSAWFRWIISSLGAFPVRRQGADAAGMRRAIDRLLQGRIVVVFPEGTRSRDGRLGKGQIGIAFLAHKAKVKVVPALIRGTDEAWGRGSKFIKPWPVSVTFGTPLEPNKILPDKPTRQNYEGFTELIMNRLCKLKEERRCN